MENFEQDGVVSVWAFRDAEDPADTDKDVLKDMCGVDYYDLDSQEGITVPNVGSAHRPKEMKMASGSPK